MELTAGLRKTLSTDERGFVLGKEVLSQDSSWGDRLEAAGLPAQQMTDGQCSVRTR